MKIRFLLYTATLLMTSSVVAQASVDAKYRVDSAESIVSSLGDRRCITALGNNSFGKVGDIVIVTLNASELFIDPESGVPEGVTLRSGHHEQTPGAPGSLHITNGVISIPVAMPDNPNPDLNPSALFQIHDKNSPAMQTISVIFKGDQLQFQSLRVGKQIETCLLSKVKN